MKILKLFLLLVLLSGCEEFGPREIEGKPLPKSNGYTSFAGIDFHFDFTRQRITFNNHNDTVIKLRVKNLTTNSVMINDLVTFSGNEQTVTDLDFLPDDQIQVEIWQGPASVWYGSIAGQKADYLGVAVLQEGVFYITFNQDYLSYLIELPVMSGADCQLSGQYPIGLPYNQTSNLLYCQNLSSDTIKVELIKLKPYLSGYQQDFELGSMWILSQSGFNDDSTKINWLYQYQDTLALRVTSYDPFDDQQILETIFGFKLDVASESWTVITQPITLP